MQLEVKILVRGISSWTWSDIVALGITTWRWPIDFGSDFIDHCLKSYPNFTILGSFRCAIFRCHTRQLYPYPLRCYAYINNLSCSGSYIFFWQWETYMVGTLLDGTAPSSMHHYKCLVFVSSSWTWFNSVFVPTNWFLL